MTNRLYQITSSGVGVDVDNTWEGTGFLTV